MRNCDDSPKHWLFVKSLSFVTPAVYVLLGNTFQYQQASFMTLTWADLKAIVFIESTDECTESTETLEDLTGAILKIKLASTNVLFFRYKRIEVQKETGKIDMEPNLMTTLVIPFLAR